MDRIFYLVFLIFVPLGTLCGQENPLLTSPVWTLPEVWMDEVNSGGDLGWPEVHPEAMPGSYWWWPGSAVNKSDLTWNLETYKAAGWGNLGVIGIYGVKGEENRFLDIFSPEWFEMYNHAVDEAERLGMNIDLTPSAGWRLGGPHVTSDYAEESFTVNGDRIEVIQRNDRVKRAGPGGEGLCINPYSLPAVKYHFNWLSNRFREGSGRPPRAFYYDSFENPGNWSPEFLDGFRRLRGYDLESHAAALGGTGEPEYVKRIMCDYRETLSDLLLESVSEITDWCGSRGSGLRMQAHGAPANLLDMYATASIPETEVFGANHFDIPGFRRDTAWTRPDPHSILVNRFASSAAHVAGRNLVISEIFTWLRNHFHTALSHIKAESDLLLLSGINGIYYHGTCFSPEKTQWPGWLFYASTQVNSRNSIFRDIPVLNAYLTRCQSVLQDGKPHNDILLYWPVYDLWMAGGPDELRFGVHNSAWIDETACGHAATRMIKQGYTFDFISGQQLRNTRYNEGDLITEGGSRYHTILLPAADFMKSETMAHLLKLAKEGASILVLKKLPWDVPGWNAHGSAKSELDSLIRELVFDKEGTAMIGKGKVIVTDNIEQLLGCAGIEYEPMVDMGLQFVRRKKENQVLYFIANQNAERIDGWVGLASKCSSVVIMDPMTGKSGLGTVRQSSGFQEIYLQITPGETRILKVFEDRTARGAEWPVLEPAGTPSGLAKAKPLQVRGTWEIEFTEGGPYIPDKITTDTLVSWAEIECDNVKSFAGAARYTIEVELPGTDADHWILDLGDVRESARIWVNGLPAGVLVAHPFRLDVSDYLQAGSNEISIEVTNLSANRIKDLDMRGVEWKKFYDINIVNHMYEPFDASRWPLKPSGLLGPVTLVPYTAVKKL